MPSQTPDHVFVVMTDVSGPFGRTFPSTKAAPSVEAAKERAEVGVERVREEFALTTSVEVGAWEDTPGEGETVARRTVTTRWGTSAGTDAEQRIIALPTTGEADQSLTALDFVRFYVLSNEGTPGGGHHIETVACAQPNPRGKTENYTCRMCEAQRILADADAGR